MRKAFDTVEHDAVMAALRSCGIDESYLVLITSFIRIKRGRRTIADLLTSDEVSSKGTC